MHIYKFADQLFQQRGYEWLFGAGSDALPPDFPSTREIKIHIAKWGRLLEAESTTPLVTVKLTGQDAKLLRGKGPSKKELREAGRRATQIMQQCSIVKNLALELLRQYFREKSAKNGAKFTNKDFAQFRLRFDTGLSEVRQQFFQKLTKNIKLDEVEKQIVRDLTLSLQPKQLP